MSKYIDFLTNTQLFQGMPQAVLEEISDLFVPVRSSKNKVIFGQGDPGDALYIILVGKVKVVLYSESGREVILAQLEPGECFGEMAVITEKPRSATVIAVDDTSLLSLTRTSFKNLVRQNPDVALHLLAVLADRLAEADEKIGDLALIDVYGRVARHVLKLAKEHGKPDESGGTVIENRPTHQEIANIVGTARETVSRAMSEFIRRGYLRIEGKNIILLQEAAALGGNA